MNAIQFLENGQEVTLVTRSGRHSQGVIEKDQNGTAIYFPSDSTYLPLTDTERTFHVEGSVITCTG